MNDMFDELINSIKQWKDNNGKTNEEEIKKITSKIAQIRAIEKSDLNAVHQHSTCQTIGINNDPLHTPATGHLAQAEHDVLTKNLRQLIDCFPYQSLIDEIFSNKILNCIEFREIDGKLTREEKNEALFDTIKSKPPGTFKLICQLYSKVRSVQYIQGQELLQQLEKHPGNHGMEIVKDSKLVATNDSVVDGPQEQVAASTNDIVEGSKSAKPYFKKLYKEVAVKWTHLALALDVKQTEIDVIKMNNPFDISQQCHIMLHKLSRKLGSSFTKSMLVEALRKSDLGDVADKIAPMTEESLRA